MRSTLTVVVFVMLAGVAAAQSPSDEREQERAYRDRMEAIQLRAWDLRPRRRDTPMRELNISDNEVREIEMIARRYVVKSMLNISPVIAGCSCEEGPLCTDQVYVVATTPDRTLTLELSRIRNAWVVGPVQRWWWQYDALQKRMFKMDFRAFLDAENQLLLEFPMCIGRDEIAEATQKK